MADALPVLAAIGVPGQLFGYQPRPLLCAKKPLALEAGEVGHGDGVGFRRNSVQPPATDRRLWPEMLDGTKAVLRRISANLTPGTWLTDDTISKVFSNYVALPDKVSLIPPAVSTMIGVADQENALDAAAWNVSGQHLVIIPVNDSRGDRAGGGTHWSLLVGISAKPPAFRPLYFDSAAGAGNLVRARTLAKRMFSPQTVLETCLASKQRNGSDCGIYMLMFAEALVESYAAAMVP